MKSIAFYDGTILHIEEKVLKKMFRYVQTEKLANEAGGILLGKKVEGREEYVLTDISVPSKKDKRGRFFFVRSKNTAQSIINQKWEETNGVENYLGEWHTHPECNPAPSQVDRNLIRQVIEDKSNVFSKVFLVITGMDKTLFVGIVNSKISTNITFSKEIRCIE